MPDAILVIGGGVAGIHVALNAAEYGTMVYLIDDTPSIGGIMARLDKTFPTNDCSICIEAPRMYEVDNHENIKIITNTEVRRITKKNGGFTVRLLQKSRFIDEEKCTGCGSCQDYAEACPSNAWRKNSGGCYHVFGYLCTSCTTCFPSVDECPQQAISIYF